MERGRSNREMGAAQFGVTFFTSSQRQDTCGTNGLPLTPNSIRILGQSQYLKSLSHPNLAAYIEIIRGKNERIIVVSEYYETNLRKILKNNNLEMNLNEQMLRLAKQVLSGLTYLNKHGIIVRNLSPETILVDSKNVFKLFNYGLYYMTNCGHYASFPMGSPKYTAPELFLSNVRKGQGLYSCDVWSLGVILVELLIKTEIWPDLKLSSVICKVSEFRKRGTNILELLLQDHGFSHILEDINPALRRLIDKCLEIDPMKRLQPKKLLEDVEIFGDSVNENSCSLEVTLEESGVGFMSIHPTSYYATKFLLSQNLHRPKRGVDESSMTTEENNIESYKNELPTDLLTERTLNEIYYLWQRAGGDVIGELKRQGLTRKKPAVLSLPNLMTLEGSTFGKSKERGLLLDNTVIVLPLNELRKRLNDIPPEDYYPLLEFSIDHIKSNDSCMVKESASLPLIIRERDIEYQFHRIILFERLLKGYPFTKNRIHKESLQDIPPYFRAQVWSCLLDIQGDIEYIYSSIDKETPTSTDRQIEVDIPRCHQYDELLSSPSGHEKFKRVLKAWVVSNKEYVYWQGLDSLCAPFLYLNFNNEAMAYSCLSSFIPKYLFNFFLKDNSVIIQEYLCKFSQLIAFHDPQLTNHLDSIGFIPELYAIPWFLTMFSHVFPLHKIFHLWDKLLLGDSSFSLCIGLAILYQLRESLLNSGFNECILLFSDMPEINIEKCVQDSVEIYCSTPKSALRRMHEPPTVDKKSAGPNSKRNSNYNRCGITNGDVNLDTEFEGSGSRFNNEALKMDAISLAELKTEKCPRISGEDFIQLLDLHRTKFQKPKIIVVDVRNHEDYNRGAVPGSINIPYSTAFSAQEDGFLIQTQETNILNSNRGKIICVVGNRGDSAVKFADAILKLGYPRICVLHRGIDIFRTSNLLVVPSTI